MGQVPVEIKRLEHGDLPAVCVKTGVPTTSTVRMTMVVTPGWTWILLLFGVLPLLIARYFASRAFVAVLPVSERAYRRQRATTRIGWLFLLGVVVAVLAAFLVGSQDLVGVAVALMIAAIVVFVTAHFQWVGAAPGRTPDEVYLTGVHPDFAHALGLQVGREHAAY